MIRRVCTNLPLLLVTTTSAAAQGADPAAPSGDPIPSHETFTITANQLAELRRVNVYTFPGYETVASSACGVLYMPDGGLGEDFPHVANAIDSLLRERVIAPVVVVGIENTERRRDMTGPTTVASDSAIAPRVGESAAFRAFIRDDLMPVVRSRYRCTGPTAIIGESLAGLFVVETFLTEPDLFDHYIALSPSLWWNRGQLVQSAAGRLGTLPGRERTLYLASADEAEIAAPTAALAGLLARDLPAGLTLLHEPRPDLQHGTIYRQAGPGALATVLR